MREIAKIKYETVVESDVHESYIYAFRSDADIAFLCRKDNEFFWKCMCASNQLWYKKYDTIEQAITGVLNVKEYSSNKCSPIYEFNSIVEFIVWAYKEFNVVC